MHLILLDTVDFKGEVRLIAIPALDADSSGDFQGIEGILDGILYRFHAILFLFCFVWLNISFTYEFNSCGMFPVASIRFFLLSRIIIRIEFPSHIVNWSFVVLVDFVAQSNSTSRIMNRAIIMDSAIIASAIDVWFLGQQVRITVKFNLTTIFWVSITFIDNFFFHGKTSPSY